MQWKGRLLEPVIGSARFAALITFFALASNALVVGVGYGLFHLIEYKGVMRQCILGWSAVLFALKVVATHYSPNSMTRSVSVCIALPCPAYCPPLAGGLVLLSTGSPSSAHPYLPPPAATG